MSLKIVKFERGVGRIILLAAAVVALFVAWSFIKWNFANTIAARMDTNAPGADRVADFLMSVAPGDPQTHLTAALIYEKTFDTNDLARSLAEYEAAASLSPFDYMRWLDLGKARGLNGDDVGALKAYARAAELAPNYASVQWAYGNSLLRSGNVEDGFALIAKAAASNPDLSKPAVTMALQVFDGDLGQVRAALGDNDNTNSALAAMLASERRFNEAAEEWSKLSPENRTGKLRPFGMWLIDQMANGKQFRSAARIVADLQSSEAERPVVGQVADGGFENGVKLRNAGLFEWQIGAGEHPQIGLAEGQSHSGRYSLFVLFNTFSTAAFRDVSQTVAVEPGAQYELEVFYRSDLKTPALLKWEVADAGSTQAIAATPILVPIADWTSMKAVFTVPSGTDGVVIRLARDGCAGPSCPMNGKLSFDDISLRRL